MGTLPLTCVFTLWGRLSLSQAFPNPGRLLSPLHLPLVGKAFSILCLSSMGNASTFLCLPLMGEGSFVFPQDIAVPDGQQLYLEVIKTDSCSYIHKSFWNNCIISSFTWMWMASQNDKSHTIPCGIGPITKPTIIYEDNAACISQMKAGYIKSNIANNLAPKIVLSSSFREKWGNRHLANKVMW